MELSNHLSFLNSPLIGLTLYNAFSGNMLQVFVNFVEDPKTFFRKVGKQS